MIIYAHILIILQYVSGSPTWTYMGEYKSAESCVAAGEQMLKEGKGIYGATRKFICTKNEQGCYHR